ncbi:MAG: hypothetical protein WC322_06140 [Candidatus Paceibacterota bacterium]|jgi:hypothetical protein
MKPEKKWQKTDPGLRSHPAFLDLVAELDSTPIMVDGMLSGLWRMAFHDAPDGDITRFKPRALARSVGWLGNADVLVHALTDCGFVDEIDGKLFIHDWSDWGGALFAERAKTAARVSRNRKVPANSDSVPVCTRTPTLPSRVDLDLERDIAQDLKPLSIAAAIDDSFELFWTSYPRAEAKKTARQKWAKLKPKERESAISAAAQMAECVQRGYQEKTYCPMPATFLNQRRWEDWETGPPVGYLPNHSDTGNLSDVLAAAAKTFDIGGMSGNREIESGARDIAGDKNACGSVSARQLETG